VHPTGKGTDCECCTLQVRKGILDCWYMDEKWKMLAFWTHETELMVSFASARSQSFDTAALCAVHK
jgi:hypothetical protein